MEKEKTTISLILRESGLSDRCDNYLGRGINYKDITPEILYNVSKNIKKYFGQKEQEVFNQMVLDLPTLRASFFINFTMHLQTEGLKDGWWWDKEIFFKKYYQRALTMSICPTTEDIKERFKKIID